ncbi:type I-E CRISPR-associated protein Cse1/CasA [Nocardia cyriacigeorgica]|uniref:type I-E CRISPR-associated protein Cse1/CasA n=1 Tax=Nocardia cyriacigeorgica TaxID=135487 RepID=UPI00189515E6|nr:type I-E CRISPR-associated protein Cse1/CasA [Nocardia cyriacigeorgica]MBF6416868.1 type I-E CRISPR-associated protein Cse1/CasA [Nocardia cyriacigeorgica]
MTTSTDSGFNLLDEAWIVALDTESRERELSILELFEQSTQLTTIGGEVPTQAFAITRLLLALLHRALDGPEDSDDWRELWQLDELPMDRIRRYTDGVRKRFDLFDPVVPFFQVADLRTQNGEVSGLEKIVADVPNGEPLFTTRSARDLRRIDASEAARWVVHTHAFDPSGIKSGPVGGSHVKNGKGYPIGPGWSGQIGAVLPHGRNLRETLLLNLIGNEDNPYTTLRGAADLPPWERDPDTAEWSERKPNGAIDLYTWQTRRIRLIGDRAGVTGVVLANGDKIVPRNRHDKEPHTCWRYSEPQSKKLKTTVYMPLIHNPERLVWQGLQAYLPGSRKPHHLSAAGPPQRLAPGVLHWVGSLCSDGVLPGSYQAQIRVIGAEYGPQNATFTEMVDDMLPMRVVLLRADEPAIGQAAVDAVEDAENVAKVVWRLAENISQAGGAEPQSGAGDRARERLYAALDGPYRRWLSRLGPGTDVEVARSDWQETVVELVRPIVSEVIAAAPPSAWRGREVNGRTVNVPLAELWSRAALRKALPRATGPKNKQPVEPESSKEVAV